MRIGLTIAGGIVGAYFGNAQMGLAIGSLVGSIAERAMYSPEAQIIEGPKPSEVNVQNSSYGIPIPWYWGSVRAAGNVIAGPYVEDIRTEEVVEGTGGGGCGAGGGEEQIVATYTRYGTFAVGLCRGPIDRVQRIWANNRLIYNMSETTGKAVAMDGLNFILYPGNETQTPDATIEAEEGVDCPAFRGLAYAMFYSMPWGEFGNQMPIFTFEIQVDATTTLPTDDIETEAINNDCLFVSQDGQYLFSEHTNVWRKYEISSGAKVQVVDLSASPAIPGTYHEQHDSDELGFIYTTKDVSANYNLPCKLDADFNVVATGGSLWATKIARVCKNPRFPYVWYTSTAAGSSVTVLDRETLLAPSGYVVTTLGVPSGHAIKDITINHSDGTCYALFNDGDDTVIRHYTPLGQSYDEYDISATCHAGVHVTFDEVSNQVIVASVNDISGGITEHPVHFYDADTLAHLNTISDDLITSYNVSTFQRGVINGNLYTQYGSGGVKKINVVTYGVTSYDTDTATAGSGRGLVYDPVTHSVIQVVSAGGATLTKCLLDRGTGDTIKLSNVVSDICEEVDLQAADIDVTDLTDDVRGYKLDGRMSARSGLQPLMDTYFFDGVESDTKLKFVKRGGASVAAIANIDLATHPSGDARPQELSRPIRQEIELPLQIDVTYINPAADYQFNNQRTRKLTTNSSNMPNLRLPVVLSDDEAKQIAYTHLSASWLSRFMYSFSLSREFFKLEPTDIITVTDKDSEAHVLRIVAQRYEGGTMTVDAVKDDATIYANSFTGNAAPTHAQEVIHYGPSHLEIVDSPAMEDSQAAAAGMYFAAMGFSSDWRGCVIYKSPAGIDWTLFTSLINSAVIGRCSDALADFPYTHWDDGNTVTIRLMDQTATLSAATKAQALEGANACLIGDELLHFTTATDNGTTYTLSGLLRGRRGTEWAKSTHAAGDRFVLLAVPGIYFQGIGLEEENTVRDYRAVSIGQSFASGITQEITSEIRNLMPLSPVHIKASRASDIVTLTWIRRTRTGGHWNDSHDVPLGETTEAYEVDIIDKHSTVLRTISSLTSETTTYTAAQQVTDGPFYAFGRWDIDSADSGTSNFPSANGKSCCRFQAPADIDVTGLMVYYQNDYAAAKAKAVIYDDTAEDPVNLVGEGTEVVGITTGWNLLPFATGQSLTKGAYYHIGVISDTTLVTSPFNNTGINAWNIDIYNGAADPFGSVSNSTTGKPIYAVTQHADVELSVKVYQISDSVGRGFAGEATV
jgi:hypothetical protein